MHRATRAHSGLRCGQAIRIDSPDDFPVTVLKQQRFLIGKLVFDRFVPFIRCVRRRIRGLADGAGVQDLFQSIGHAKKLPFRVDRIAPRDQVPVKHSRRRRRASANRCLDNTAGGHKADTPTNLDITVFAMLLEIAALLY